MSREPVTFRGGELDGKVVDLPAGLDQFILEGPAPDQSPDEPHRDIRIYQRVGNEMVAVAWIVVDDKPDYPNVSEAFYSEHEARAVFKAETEVAEQEGVRRTVYLARVLDSRTFEQSGR